MSLWRAQQEIDSLEFSWWQAFYMLESEESDTEEMPKSRTKATTDEGMAKLMMGFVQAQNAYVAEQGGG